MNKKNELQTKMVKEDAKKLQLVNELDFDNLVDEFARLRVRKKTGDKGNAPFCVSQRL